MAAELENKTVLIAEDEPALLAALSEKFTRAGFSVHQAKNGKKALALALAKHPNIILLDLLMPVMDGMSMMKELRKEGTYGKSVPIIILTNIAPDDKIMRGVVEDEPAFYLLKTDWNIDDVVTKVQEVLDKP